MNYLTDSDYFLSVCLLLSIEVLLRCKNIQRQNMTTYSTIQKHATLKHYTKWCDKTK